MSAVCASSRFNPRATGEGRATLEALAGRALTAVSIHARPVKVARRLVAQSLAFEHGRVSIHARPVKVARHDGHGRHVARGTGFNPRATGEGRATADFRESAADFRVSIHARPVKVARPRSPRGPRAHCSFNPRATGEGRATTGTGGTSHEGQVSIHARPVKVARPACAAALMLRTRRFNPRATGEGRATSASMRSSGPR